LGVGPRDFKSGPRRQPVRSDYRFHPSRARCATLGIVPRISRVTSAAKDGKGAEPGRPSLQPSADSDKEEGFYEVPHCDSVIVSLSFVMGIRNGSRQSPLGQQGWQSELRTMAITM
jgi:hypothetical protein